MIDQVWESIILENIVTLIKHVLCLDTVENQPVFNPDLHTELIIKDEKEGLGSQKPYIQTKKSETERIQ